MCIAALGTFCTHTPVTAKASLRNPHSTYSQAVQHGVDEVAVKRIRSLSPTMAQLRTFHNEVDCLRRLCHRNIVQVGEKDSVLSDRALNGQIMKCLLSCLKSSSNPRHTDFRLLPTP